MARVLGSFVWCPGVLNISRVYLRWLHLQFSLLSSKAFQNQGLPQESILV